MKHRDLSWGRAMFALLLAVGIGCVVHAKDVFQPPKPPSAGTFLLVAMKDGERGRGATRCAWGMEVWLHPLRDQDAHRGFNSFRFRRQREHGHAQAFGQLLKQDGFVIEEL